MKNLPSLLLAAIALTVTGCESGARLPSVFRERISPTYRTHVVSAEQRAAYDAALVAIGELSYKVTSGGPAQGKIEAMSALRPGAGERSARQGSVSVRLEPASGGGTLVSVLFSEIREDEFSKREGMGTSTAIQDSGLYDVFFRNIDEALAAGGK